MINSAKKYSDKLRLASDLGGLATLAILVISSIVKSYTNGSEKAFPFDTITTSIAVTIWAILGVIHLLRKYREKRILLKLRGTYVTFDNRIKELQTLIEDLKQLLMHDPNNKIKLLQGIDSAILEALLVSSVITDNRDHPLSCNFMEFVPGKNILELTRILGMYNQRRLFRQFKIGKIGEEGSCGQAWREGQIIIIPNTSKQIDKMSFPIPEEKNILRGVMNIPIKIDDSYGGVLNIDSPMEDILTDEYLEKAKSIQTCMREILLLRREIK